MKISLFHNPPVGNTPLLRRVSVARKCFMVVVSVKQFPQLPFIPVRGRYSGFWLWGRERALIPQGSSIDRDLVRMDNVMHIVYIINIDSILY